MTIWSGSIICQLILKAAQKYSLMCAFCVWRSIFKLLLISPCWLFLCQHPRRVTLPFFLIAALLKWLFFYYFFNHQREECCMLFSLPDTASWQRTLKLCHERKLSKMLLWFSVSHLCCFYWGTFRKARGFFSLAEEIKFLGGEIAGQFQVFPCMLKPKFIVLST